MGEAAVPSQDSACSVSASLVWRGEQCEPRSALGTDGDSHSIGACSSPVEVRSPSAGLLCAFPSHESRNSYESDSVQGSDSFHVSQPAAAQSCPAAADRGTRATVITGDYPLKESALYLCFLKFFLLKLSFIS